MATTRRKPYRNGKDGLLETFVREHTGMAIKLAYRLSGNVDESQDLVQESLYRVLRSWGRYDSSRPFAAWFCTILWNVFIDRRRVNGNRHSVSLDPPAGWNGYEGATPDCSGSALEQLERKETAMLVRDALGKLNRAHRTVLTLHHLEGLKYREIAGTLGVPPGTIRSRMFRARERFRRCAGALAALA